MGLFFNYFNLKVFCEGIFYGIGFAEKILKKVCVK